MLVRILLELFRDVTDILLWEVYEDGEEAFIAVLDSLSLKSVLNRVSRRNVIANLISEAICFHFAISLVNECARHGNVQVHQTTDKSCVYNRKVLLVGLRN